MSATNLIVAIKKITRQTMASYKFSDVVGGTVVSISPLQIQIDQKLILNEEHITVSEHIGTFEVEITIGNEQKQKCLIHNELKVGESVKMIRYFGGQHFLVIDKG